MLTIARKINQPVMTTMAKRMKTTTTTTTSSPSSSSFKVLISGKTPAALALAARLSKKKMEVDLIHSPVSFDPSSVSLLSPGALLSLQSAGVDPSTFRKGEVEELTVERPNRTGVGRVNVAAFGKKWDREREMMGVEQGEMQKKLEEVLNHTACFRTANVSVHQITSPSASDKDRRAMVTFRGGRKSPSRYDLVVFADGPSSAVSGLFASHFVETASSFAPSLYGTHSISIPRPPSLPDAVVEIWGDESRVVLIPEDEERVKAISYGEVNSHANFIAGPRRLSTFWGKKPPFLHPGSFVAHIARSFEEGNTAEECYAEFPENQRLKNVTMKVEGTTSQVVVTGNTYYNSNLMSYLNTSLDLESVSRLANQLEEALVNKNKSVEAALKDYSSKTLARTDEFDSGASRFAVGLRPDTLSRSLRLLFSCNSFALSFTVSKLFGNSRSVSL